MSFTGFFSGRVSDAYTLLNNCFGYVAGSQWYVDATGLKQEIDEGRDAAVNAAEESAQLLPARALSMSAGPTALHGAIAQASVHAKTAKEAATKAVKDQTELHQLLTDNSMRVDAVGATPDIVLATQNADKAANATWTTLREARAPSDAWYALSARLNGGILTRLNVLKTTPSAGPTDALFEAHGKLCTLLNNAAGPTFEVPKVTSAVQQVTASLGKFEQAVAKVETKAGGGSDQLEKLRAAALKQFETVTGGYGLSDVVATTVTKLQEVNPRIKPQHLAGLTKSQDAAPSRLAAALQGAKNPAEIDAALDEALRSYRESVTAMAVRTNNGSGLPPLKHKAEAALQHEREEAQFEEKRAELEEALQDLRSIGATTYAADRERYETIVSDTKKSEDYKRATDTLLPALMKTIERDYTKHKQTTEPEITALKNEVEKLRQEFALAKKSPAAKTAGALLTTIESNLKDASSFLDCNGNLEAAEPAKEIIADVKTLLQDFTSASSLFATLAQTLQEIKTGLAHADLKVIPPADLTSLTQRLADLQVPDNGLAPQAFKSEVELLKKDLADQTTFGGELKRWREASGVQLGTLTSTFETYAKAIARAPATTFGTTGAKPDPTKGEIKAALDVLESLLTTGVGLDGFDEQKTEWITFAKQATDGLADVWDDGAKAIKDGAACSKDAEAGTQRAELARTVTEAWQTLRDKAKGYGQQIAEAKGNVGEYQILSKQLDAMKSEIEKDPEVARAQLADIEKRLQGIRGTPDFDQAIAREIGKVPAEWGKVLDLTRVNLDTLVQSIDGAATGTDFAGSIGDLRGLVDGVKQRFAADAFTDVAEPLAKPDPTGSKREERRAKREEGLRLVRQYQAQLLNDPLVKHLQSNPFGVALFGQMFRFLDRVELEFTRIAS